MIRDVILVVEQVSSQVNFLANFVVFIGGAYIALHSRNIPKWIITCLWYIGLASLLNALTIVIGWSFGDTHPMSHFQIGVFTETLINVMLAMTVGILFFKTVWQDYLGSKQRQSAQDKKEVAPTKTVAKRTTKVAPVKSAVKTTRTPRVSRK